MAGGFVIGAALGAAVGAGASEWTSDGDGSIAISAAVGGGLVAVAVLAGAGYRWLFPDVAYDDFVVSCLTKMGYEVGGWE
jgi:hypothetical protein